MAIQKGKLSPAEAKFRRTTIKNARGIGASSDTPRCPKCGGKIVNRSTSRIISGSVKETVTECENYPTCGWTKS